LVTEKFVRLMFLMLKLQSLNKSNSWTWSCISIYIIFFNSEIKI
jgi:hypothetical protein